MALVRQPVAADTLVVMPTIRDYGVMRDYFRNADQNRFSRDRLFVLLLTEDFCDKQAMQAMLDDEGVEGAVLGQTERDRWFTDMGIAEHASIVPRRSHAETSFGLLWQWHHGFDTGIFIDDDTVPTDDDYFGGHHDNLAGEGELPRVRSQNGWVNVLWQGLERHHLHPRGFPYAHMDAEYESSRGPLRDVVASQGLWTNVADLDAARILVGGDLQGQGSPRTEERDFPGSFVVEDAHQTTVCSMNLAFKREVVPAFYQFPMDDNEWKVGRFDDIWSGFCLKHVADARGQDLVHGRPLCVHNKAPRSTFKDLVAEANGLELNEHFTKLLPELEPGVDWSDAYRKMGAAVEAAQTDYVNGDFLGYVGKRMQEWVDVVHKLD